MNLFEQQDLFGIQKITGRICGRLWWWIWRRGGGCGSDGGTGRGRSFPYPPEGSIDFFLSEVFGPEERDALF